MMDGIWGGSLVEEKLMVFPEFKIWNYKILYLLPLPSKVDGGYVFTPVCMSICLSCLCVCEQNISKS